MSDIDAKLQGEIVAAVKRTIQKVGVEALKQTSLFGSNDSQDVGTTLAELKGETDE